MNNNKQPDPPVGQIITGDALEQLREMPNESVDCVVTSPPFFRLRNYRIAGQLGLEQTVDGWVENLVAVLAEVRRVLKPTGVVFLNVGDSFSRSDRTGAPPKALVLGPERLALALATDGWRVRNKVVWAKPNPMPASVRDRLACTWEPIYLLTKSRHYYFDLDSVRVPHRSRRPKQDVVPPRRPRLVPSWQGPLAGVNDGLERMRAEGRAGHPLGKNPGDVWTIPTSNYRGAHFATFPEALVERPIKAGCPERVCALCGQPWWRSPVKAAGEMAVIGQLRKSCGCELRDWRPGIVLDPFVGSGTTAVVAERLGRRWVGIELKPAFVRLAEERIEAARGQREAA